MSHMANTKRQTEIFTSLRALPPSASHAFALISFFYIICATLSSHSSKRTQSMIPSFSSGMFVSRFMSTLICRLKPCSEEMIARLSNTKLSKRRSASLNGRCVFLRFLKSS